MPGGRRPRAKVLMDPEKPKVDPDKLAKVLRGAGADLVTRKADFGLAVGGDGVFSRFGRVESIPLLFVGVRSDGPTGSKAFLASTYLDGIKDAIRDIAEGRYAVLEYRRLQVIMNRRVLGDVFTDTYLQRGADSNCIRYSVKVEGPGTLHEESAISDGVAVCTRAGSTGYFSYVDKIRSGDWLDPDAHTLVGEDQIGVCHVMPTYTERKGTGQHPLRYTVPWRSLIRLSLDRPADARLYGAGGGRRGIRVRLDDEIVIRPAKSTTKVITLATAAA